MTSAHLEALEVPFAAHLLVVVVRLLLDRHVSEVHVQVGQLRLVTAISAAAMQPQGRFRRRFVIFFLDLVLVVLLVLAVLLVWIFSVVFVPAAVVVSIGLSLSASPVETRVSAGWADGQSFASIFSAHLTFGSRI